MEVPGRRFLPVTGIRVDVDTTYSYDNVRPEEFGAACAFLCSAHAGYITGQNIFMDGGAYPGTF
jgi:NAD(P)-dependent dehydrogenase (short-subunit alcohol dehydrogenase family)